MFWASWRCCRWRTSRRKAAAAKVVDAVADSQPSVKAAIEAVPAKDLGVSRSKPMTAPQREKAGRTLMESYIATGAPNVTRELIRQGRLDDAKKFDAWVKDSRAADGMAAWGRGIFAALQGDADSAAESFMDAYNASGYFDDGMDVVKEMVAAGEIGSLHDYWYATVGNGTSVANSKKFAADIAEQLLADHVEGVILTST